MTRADLIAALEKLEGSFTTPLYSNQQRRDLIALAARAGLTERELDALDGALGGSLDAALSLVPEGHAWLFKSFGVATVYKIPPSDDDETWPIHHDAKGATSAIALVIAALRAMD
jgi:hypothetical protein